MSLFSVGDSENEITGVKSVQGDASWVRKKEGVKLSHAVCHRGIDTTTNRVICWRPEYK